MPRNETKALLALAAIAFSATLVGCPSADIVPEPTAPSVASTLPASDAVGVALDADISATFATPMDAGTISAETFTLSRDGARVSGAVSYAGLTATFNPSAGLAGGAAYTATITTGTADADGNPLAEAVTWSFTTADEPDVPPADIVPPTVQASYPADSASGVAVDAIPTVSFDEAMAPGSVVSPEENIYMIETVGSVPVAGSVLYDSLTATFTPDAHLVAGTEYTVRVTTGVTDLAGNHLAVEHSWSFSTAGLRPIFLKTAGDFVILTKLGVNVGATTTIEGDIGVSPGLADTLVGLALVPDASGAFSKSSTATITGTIYADDYAEPTPTMLAQAIVDMEAAYADAIGRPGATALDTGELGGRTLAPGIYHWIGAASITTEMTLSGGLDDIWIIQIDGSLTMEASIQVKLEGGARAGNVFWRTTGPVAIGATSTFYGIVLCDAAITLGASSVVQGRLFAEGQANLEASLSLTQPSP